MSKFENEMYQKGYNDGFSDAINNPAIEDIAEMFKSLSAIDKQKLMELIQIK